MNNGKRRRVGQERERERIDKQLDICPQGSEKDNGVTLTHA